MATARAEAVAAQTIAEETKRIAATKTLQWQARIAELQQTQALANEAESPAARKPPKRRPSRAEASPATPPNSRDATALPLDLAPEALPVVVDRLQLPKAERAAYDDGVAAGRNGWEEKVPRRFQPGQRLAHLLHYRRAGYRDGLAARQAQTASRASPAIPERPSDR